MDTLVITGELYTFNLPSKGDSYISMPVIPADPSPDAVFGHGSEVIVLEFDLATQLYVHPSALECAKGYYIYSSVAKTVTVSGTDCIVTIDDLIAIYNSLAADEWAMVGPGMSAIDTTGTVLYEKVLRYDYATDDFVPTIILNPKEGYWIGKEAAHNTSLTKDITDIDGNPITKGVVGQEIYVGGQLKDTVTDTPIENAEIILYRNGVSTNITDLTDSEGIYSISYILEEEDKPEVIFKTVFAGAET